MVDTYRMTGRDRGRRTKIYGSSGAAFERCERGSAASAKNWQGKPNDELGRHYCRWGGAAAACWPKKISARSNGRACERSRTASLPAARAAIMAGISLARLPIQMRGTKAARAASDAIGRSWDLVLASYAEAAVGDQPAGLAPAIDRGSRRRRRRRRGLGGLGAAAGGAIGAGWDRALAGYRA